MTRVSPIFLGMLLVPLAAHAGAAQPVTVHVEIAERTGQGRPVSGTLTLALAGERDCGEASESRGASVREVRVCRRGGEAGAPVVTFRVEVRTRGSRGVRHRRFKATARLALGRRATIGRSVGPDGVATEVTAIVRE